ncbi:MAG: hypothetical protein KZQ58_04195 [gamma proteobacterium symbiont of Bathyaustriella thionipta]|nr:hypothetical protein [gamma proteobacterium symbiont of Bathyaustriella thionipta]
MLLNIVIILVALSLASWFAFSQRLSASSDWSATVSPLASIMGSGFLISAPLLAGIVGNLAVLCMALLLLLAFWVGDAIRFNIRHFEPIERKTSGAAQNIAELSRIVLVAAYFVSVTYYLELLGAFVLKAIGIDSEIAANSITSLLLFFICAVGMWRGLQELEAVEKYAVSLNLGMIGALLLSLIIYNIQLLMTGNWALPVMDSGINLHDFRVLMGLLIVVQGFEISRYLGDIHPPEQRISSMRSAQLLSSLIYLLFLGLATVLFHPGLGSDVTAIIDLTTPVAMVLPALLAITAIGSQFSAAVADASGAGGLVEDISGHKIRIRYVYMLILM